MVHLVLLAHIGRCFELVVVVVVVVPADGRRLLVLVRTQYIDRIRPNKSKSCPTDRRDP